MTDGSPSPAASAAPAREGNDDGRATDAADLEEAVKEFQSDALQGLDDEGASVHKLPVPLETEAERDATPRASPETRPPPLQDWPWYAARFLGGVIRNAYGGEASRRSQVRDWIISWGLNLVLAALVARTATGLLGWTPPDVGEWVEIARSWVTSAYEIVTTRAGFIATIVAACVTALAAHRRMARIARSVIKKLQDKT